MSGPSEQRLQSATGIDKIGVQSSPTVMKGATDSIVVHIAIGGSALIVVGFRNSKVSASRLSSDAVRSESHNCKILSGLKTGNTNFFNPK